MSERTTLRVALVGAGAAGQAHAFGYRNVSMAAGLESVQIDTAVVVDPNIELARRTADRYGYTDATADLQRVLDDPSIDAISVALPNSVHAEVLPAILRSDKHVLTEKPLGRNAAEAAELVALAGQSSAVTGVGFSFRRLPGLAAVHDLLAANAIGEVHSFTAWYNADYAASADAPFSWRYAKETAGAGALIDIGTHAIDAVQHVIAPVREIISSTLRTVIDRRPIPGSSEFGIVDTDDIALLTVELTNGAVGQIHVNRVASGVPNSLGLEIHGSHGHARFDSISAGEFYLHTDDGPASLAGPRRVFTGPQHPYFTDVAAMPGGGVGTGYAEAFVAEVQHFVRCIVANAPMDTSFPSAHRVMRVVDAAKESARQATPVTVDEIHTTLASAWKDGTMTPYARLHLGTAPDSWGIWFPDDPKQPHWSTFLDEVVESGFRTIELGPFGYLPTHPEQLKDELGKRGLTLTGGTVGTATHRGAEAFEESRRGAFAVCELLAAMDVHHLVVLPEMYTDLHTGALTQPAELTAEQWRDLVDGQSQLGKVVAERFDVRLAFHPHVDTHVDTQVFIDKFLDDTDPEFVSLCLDTGHIEYCSGDNRDIVGRHPDRISYIHLKQVNPRVAAQAREERVGFYEAVQRGAMVEPPLGAPAMKPLLDDLAALNRDLRLIIEQDMYPAPKGSAKAIAARTRDYFAGLGLPPAEV